MVEALKNGGHQGEVCPESEGKERLIISLGVWIRAAIVVAAIKS
jgi:hypothetical protein